MPSGGGMQAPPCCILTVLHACRSGALCLHPSHSTRHLTLHLITAPPCSCPCLSVHARTIISGATKAQGL